MVFPNDPIMLCIAQKESGTAQFRPSTGKVIVSPTGDYGVMQINKKSWSKTAELLGYDINKPLDNIQMAKHIKSVQGYSAWTTYKFCKPSGSSG